MIVADADGGNAVVIDRMIEAPSPITWSADGRFIVYSKIVGEVDQVVVAATDGSSIRVVTGGPEANWGPALNPTATIAIVKGFPLVLGIFAIGGRHQRTAPHEHHHRRPERTRVVARRRHPRLQRRRLGRGR